MGKVDERQDPEILVLLVGVEAQKHGYPAVFSEYSGGTGGSEPGNRLYSSKSIGI